MCGKFKAWRNTKSTIVYMCEITLLEHVPFIYQHLEHSTVWFKFNINQFSKLVLNPREFNEITIFFYLMEPKPIVELNTFKARLPMIFFFCFLLRLDSGRSGNRVLSLLNYFFIEGWKLNTSFPFLFY